MGARSPRLVGLAGGELALAEELAEGGLAGGVGAEHLDELGGGGGAARLEEPAPARHQVLVEHLGGLTSGESEGTEQVTAR